jgi:hypothetical protein
MRIYTRNERHIIRYWLRLISAANPNLDQETIMQRTNRTSAYHIVQQGNQYRVYDKQGHFRISYPTRQDAEQYIVAHTQKPMRASTHNNTLSNQDAAE